MTAPYSNLRRILAEAGMTVLDKPVAPKHVVTGAAAALAEALLENPSGAVHFQATASVANHRREHANKHLHLIGDTRRITIERLDPRAPGGAGRVSPWEATLVANMTTNTKEARK